MKAWFITSPSALEAKVPGGVQLCSQEFLAVVRAAFPQTEVVTIPHSQRMMDRFFRKTGTSPFRLFGFAEVIKNLDAQAGKTGRPDVVFLNTTETVRLAGWIKQMDPRIRTVLLSHGTQVGDDLYEIAGEKGRRNQGLRSAGATWKLGLDLRFESCRRRKDFDLVVVMSEEEAVLERWLGSPATFMVPRVICPNPLRSRPVPGRVGYVGTLDHTPNLAGLEMTLSMLQGTTAQALEIRVVGGPTKFGLRLAASHPRVSYLGAPQEEGLKQEAATWSLFINPIFWLSKGASMKLGKVLSWKIPFVSTRSGARGYALRGLEDWITRDDPAALTTALCRQIQSGEAGRLSFEKAWDASRASWPDAQSLGAALRQTILQP
jgi:hypothetical protein